MSDPAMLRGAPYGPTGLQGGGSIPPFAAISLERHPQPWHLDGMEVRDARGDVVLSLETPLDPGADQDIDEETAEFIIAAVNAFQTGGNEAPGAALAERYGERGHV